MVRAALGIVYRLCNGKWVEPVDLTTQNLRVLALMFPQGAEAGHPDPGTTQESGDSSS